MDKLESLIKFLFDESIMETINGDHHKNDDGILEITYCWYYDNNIQGEHAWEVYHPGYVRGNIRGTGKTLNEAIDNFKKNYKSQTEALF